MRFLRPCQLRVRVANESETVLHWAFRFLFVEVGVEAIGVVVGCKLLSSPMLLLLMQPLLLRSLKCSIKLVQPAIAQESLPPSLCWLLQASDIFFFYGFLRSCGSIDPAKKIHIKKQQAREYCSTGFCWGRWSIPRPPLDQEKALKALTQMSLAGLLVVFPCLSLSLCLITRSLQLSHLPDTPVELRFGSITCERTHCFPAFSDASPAIFINF